MVSGAEEKLVLFDRQTMQPIREFKGHKDFVQAMVFTHDSKRIISVSYDQTVRFWDIASGLEVSQLAISEGVPTSVAISRETQQLVVGTNQGNVYRWNLATGQQLPVLSAHKDSIRSLRYSQVSDIFVTGSMDESAKVWDVEGNLLQTLSGHKGPILSMALSADASTIATGSGDKTMRLWTTATGKDLLAAQGHTDTVTSLGQSCNGKRIVSSSFDKTVRLWDTTTGAQLQSWATETDVAAVALDHSGKKAVAGDNTTILVWDGVTGKELYRLLGHANQVRWLGFGEEGAVLYSADWDGVVCLWDMLTGKLVKQLVTGTNIERVALLNNGQVLACGQYNGNITVWETATGKQLLSWKAHDLVVTGLVATPDGAYLVSGSEDRMLKLWKTSSGSLLNSTETGAVIRLTLLDGESPAVLALLQGKLLEVWSVPAWQKLQKIATGTQPTSVVSPHHTNGYFWLGNTNGTIHRYQK